MEWIGDLQFTDSGDRLAQPDKLLAIQLVGTPKVVNDASSGLVSLGVSNVVGQLIIGDNGAILVLSSCSS